jgi:hypothetical protein
LANMRKNFLGGSKDDLSFRIRQDMVSMVSIYPDIMIKYGSVPPYSDQKLNKSISALLGKEAHGVRGPVIAYGLIESEYEDGEHSGFVSDLDTTDLTVITN